MERAVIVVDESLGPGYAADAAAVLAVTLSAVVPGLPGPDFVDRDGVVYPGLIPMGLPILKAPRAQLQALRERAVAAGDVTVVAFPRDGQQTTDYDEFRTRVAAAGTDEIEHLGVALYGPHSLLNKLAGSLPLLR